MDQVKLEIKPGGMEQMPKEDPEKFGTFLANVDVEGVLRFILSCKSTSVLFRIVSAQLLLVFKYEELSGYALMWSQLCLAFQFMFQLVLLSVCYRPTRLCKVIATIFIQIYQSKVVRLTPLI